MEMVVLVDQHDNEIGSMEKMEAHHKGLLHRAFSILLFNNEGKVLLQKRARSKYHSAGLWTNTCCSHPLPGESMEIATSRRLREEMGINAPMQFAYKFIYKAPLERDLTEHECDYVFLGTYNGEPMINPAEVEDWKFADLEWVKNDMNSNPDSYTYWFKIIANDPKLPSWHAGSFEILNR